MLNLKDTLYRIATCILKRLNYVKKNRRNQLHPKSKDLYVPFNHLLMLLLSRDVLKLHQINYYFSKYRIED